MSNSWSPKDLGGTYCDPNDPSTFGVDKQGRVAWAGRGLDPEVTFCEISSYWMLKMGKDYLTCLGGICTRNHAFHYLSKEDAFDAKNRFCNTYPSYWPKRMFTVVRVKVKVRKFHITVVSIECEGTMGDLEQPDPRHAPWAECPDCGEPIDDKLDCKRCGYFGVPK